MNTPKNHLASIPQTGTPPTAPTRSALLRLAFIVNSLADSASGHDLPTQWVLAAVREGRLLELLQQHSGRRPDFAFLQSAPCTFDELNSALRDSSIIMQNRVSSEAAVHRNGYCLTMALVLYAIREKFPEIWPERRLVRVNSTKFD